MVRDITEIPVLDAVLCSEVLKHVPEPTDALDEFQSLLKPDSQSILTTPFESNVHVAPYHFCSGFSCYWYEHHLPLRGLTIIELTANGDWYALLWQEISRLGGLERQRGIWTWPLTYFAVRRKKHAEGLACFSWQCVARKES